ncbi:hypothetical protein [Paenibacillus gansuensis]|uniref:Uncharacterized protein n=1 Tax=Paenibacillus gansuensis TaxID=306542 RepID=A0ABW5PK62_9BACL
MPNNPKSYQPLIKDRIYIGSAEDIADMLKSEHCDVVLDIFEPRFGHLCPMKQNAQSSASMFHCKTIPLKTGRKKLTPKLFKK